MTEKHRINVDDAYALESPEDNIRLYAEWADSYDSDFVSRLGYVYHQEVTRQLVERFGPEAGAVLDVGCGTGVVGVALADAGISCIDGIDISAQMLGQSRRKKSHDGRPVYRNLIEADLTKPLVIPNSQYEAIVSAGTFTHGHLGPDSLDELWRVAKPGAICVIGVNALHYESLGFEETFSKAVAAGKISEPKLVSANIYAGKSDDSDHASDKALIVVCRRI